MKSIILLLVFFELFAGVLIGAQTSESIRQRYGKPVSESYQVKPGIFVVVTYGADDTICEMLIQSAPDSAPIKHFTPTLKSKEIREVIDELAPKSSRGNFIIGGFVNIFCPPENDCAGVSEDWEKVSIYINGNIDQHRYATIQWKTTGCKSQRDAKPESAQQQKP
jgi:hypothetical protein